MRVIRCAGKIAEGAVLKEEALREVWPCKCWVDPTEDALCPSLRQGLLWRLWHLQVPQQHCCRAGASRAMMQSRQLINLSTLSVRQLQDHS